jgi:arginine metabolism regulation protein II
VKCDLGQPLCNNCCRLKIPCEGYIRKYSWLPPKIFDGKRSSNYDRRRPGPGESIEDAEENQSSRRVLFSGNYLLRQHSGKVTNVIDTERAAMVSQMKTECSLKSPTLE